MSKICIVMSNYYKDVCGGIYKKSLKTLSQKGTKNKLDLKVVPGAFEIPVTISRNINKYDGFVAIGCVIKGETPNFEFISKAITYGIMNLSIRNKKPIGNAIITCLTKKQALKRFKKGEEAAKAVLEVLKV